MKSIDIPLLLYLDYQNRSFNSSLEALDLEPHDDPLSMSKLGKVLESSSSTIHQSILRSQSSQLLARSVKTRTKYSVNRQALIGFLIYGIRYVFPVIPAGVTRGMPTASSADSFPGALITASDLPFVWPGSGSTNGLAIKPLHKSVPALSSEHKELYRMFVVIDALRIGSTREADLARHYLEGLL